MKKIRVRFAPSPTGPLHLGGVRTALYNYLFAKKHGGKFIIRIEDTDQLRYVPDTEHHILDSLAWLGLDHDEGPIKGGDFGPYRQSQRKTIYAEHRKTLIDNGRAYYAFDSAEELNAMRERKKAEGIHSPKYDHSVRDEMRNSLSLPADEVQKLIEVGANVTVRLKVPKDETITFNDAVRGEVSFQSNELDDKILLKSDGMPTYHMANIIDDYSMQISHVIRGEDWLSSTAHHILLYRAFGWDDSIPEFVHLPLIHKPTGKGKLSKRDGAKFGFPSLPTAWKAPLPKDSFSGYREAGFLPEAVNNFLAFLGWNPGTEKEVYSMAELIQDFSLDKIVKSGARFDWDKSKWYNQQFIIAKQNDELAQLIKPELLALNYKVSDQYIASFCGLMKERVSSLNDFVSLGKFFFEAPSIYEEKMIRKKFKLENIPHFKVIGNILLEISDFNAPNLESTIKGYMEQHELKFGEIFPILRLAISGTMKGPDLFSSIALIGPHESSTRLNQSMLKFEDIKNQAMNAK